MSTGAPPTVIPSPAAAPASAAALASADRSAPTSASRAAARLVITAVASVPLAFVVVVFGVAAVTRSNVFAGISGSERLSIRAVQAIEGAVAAIALYLLVSILLAWITRPRRVRPDPPTMELGDDPVPPAVAGFLVNAWLTPREAAQGTLLDLGARRFLIFEQTQRGHTTVNVNAGADTTTLMPYELRVLNHVRSLASNGTVPGDALATWPQQKPESWFAAFGNEVAADARRRGLAQRRWPAWSRLVLSLLAAVAAALSALALSLAPRSTHGHGDNRSAALAVGVVAWAILSGLHLVIRSDRDTRLGRIAAAHWLGVRRQLRADEVFPTLPPSAIAIWDRYLGYGAALGAAGEAVRELPLGAEDPNHAWSSFGGRWRMVTVRYPQWRPGWGVSPGALVARALPLILVGVAPLALLLLSGNLGAPLLAAVLFALVVAGWGAWDVSLAALDFRRRRWVVGRVLRTREVRGGQNNAIQFYWVAVDDGTGSCVDAWRVPPAKARAITEGTDVTGVITPHCASVVSIERRTPAYPPLGTPSSSA
jgi:hypothetical protein